MQRAIASLVVRKSSTLKVESVGCIPPACLVANPFLQLLDWLESVFDQRASANANSRFAFHSNAEREPLPIRGIIERGKSDKVLPAAAAHSGRTDPVQFSAQCAITLIWKCFKEKSDRLAHNNFRQSTFVQ